MRHLYKRNDKGMFFPNKVQCGVKYEPGISYGSACREGDCVECLKSRVAFWETFPDEEKRNKNISVLKDYLEQIHRDLFHKAFNLMVDE